MAKKMAEKRPPPPAPPSSSSSDEEESSSDDEEPITKSPIPKTPTNNNQEADGESESGSSDEETVTKSPVHKTPTNNKGEETDDESDSDSGKDKEDGEEAEKPRSDSKKPESVPTTATATATATPALKPLDAGEKSNKKGEVNGKGKSTFQRIWSLDDEITILKSIIEFESKHGRFKRDGVGIRDFHHFVKDSLSLEVNDTQLYEKIRSLKRKYETAASRARKNGKAVKSGKPHDEKVYNLSKEIWGAANENEVELKSKRASKKPATVAHVVGGSLKRKYLFLNDALANVGHDISVEVLATLEPERASFFENKFKEQKVAGLRSKICELDLMKQALNFIVDDIESTVD